MKKFECKINYSRSTDEGKLKKVCEVYVVGALTCAEAEAILMRDVVSGVKGEWNIRSIRQSRVSEIIKREELENSIYYKTRVSLCVFNEERGTESWRNVSVLVNGDGMFDVLNELGKRFDGETYRILSISETNVKECINLGK